MLSDKHDLMEVVHPISHTDARTLREIDLNIEADVFEPRVIPERKLRSQIRRLSQNSSNSQNKKPEYDMKDEVNDENRGVFPRFVATRYCQPPPGDDYKNWKKAHPDQALPSQIFVESEALQLSSDDRYYQTPATYDPALSPRSGARSHVKGKTNG